MSAKIVSDIVSRRKAFSLIGLSVAFGFLRLMSGAPVAMIGGTGGAQVTLSSVKQAPA